MEGTDSYMKSAYCSLARDRQLGEEYILFYESNIQLDEECILFYASDR